MRSGGGGRGGGGGGDGADVKSNNPHRWGKNEQSAKSTCGKMRACKKAKEAEASTQQQKKGEKQRKVAFTPFLFVALAFSLFSALWICFVFAFAFSFVCVMLLPVFLKTIFKVHHRVSLGPAMITQKSITLRSRICALLDQLQWQTDFGTDVIRSRRCPRP